MPLKAEKSDSNFLYSSAINLMNHEGDLVWSRFNVFILANTILFILIGELLKTNNKQMSILVVSFVGLILTFLWLISTVRGFEAIEYWNCSIREIEEAISGKDAVINLFIRGEKYFKLNQQVKFKFNFANGKEALCKRGCFTRCIPINVTWTAYLSIGLILLLYIGVIVLYFYGWLPSWE